MRSATSSGSPRTEAEQALSWLATDWLKAWEVLRGELSGHPRLAARFSELPDDAPTDFLSAALGQMAERLLPAMTADRPAWEQELPWLTIGVLDDQEPSATLSSFSDGSRLVLITGGLMGLLRTLSELMAVWQHASGGPGWRGAPAKIRKVLQSPDRDRDVRMIAVALRWHLVHRRQWGMPATLAVELRGRDDDYCEYYSQLALVFVLAHECAHFFLGHDGADKGSWEAEVAADAVAFRATCDYLRLSDGEDPRADALVAARLAMFAIHLVERALFVRPPVEHPPATRRWDALEASVDHRVAVASATAITVGLQRALDRAADLRFALPEPWWAEAYGHPAVHCDIHEPDYYSTTVPFLDRLSFGDPDDPFNILELNAETYGVDARTATLVAKGQGLIAGLTELGLDRESAEQATNADGPLSYRTLMEVVLASEVVSQAPDTTTARVIATAATTLLGGLERGIL